MLKTALFGSVADLERFNTMLLAWLALCAITTHVSLFAAASLFVLPFWALIIVFAVCAFDKRSMAAWRKTSILAKAGLFLLLLLPVVPAGLANSPPLFGLAIFSIGTGILGFLMRAAFSHALRQHDKERESIQ